jgi:hypothetical protein
MAHLVIQISQTEGQNKSTNQFSSKVLTILPTPGNPLHARYFGPYIVDKKVSHLNYVILTPKRRK